MNNESNDVIASFRIFTPRACATGKAIGLSVCQAKIARSGDLGALAKCKYHFSVGKVGKLTFFSLFDT